MTARSMRPGSGMLREEALTGATEYAELVSVSG